MGVLSDRHLFGSSPVKMLEKMNFKLVAQELSELLQSRRNTQGLNDGAGYSQTPDDRSANMSFNT